MYFLEGSWLYVFVGFWFSCVCRFLVLIRVHPRYPFHPRFRGLRFLPCLSNVLYFTKSVNLCLSMFICGCLLPFVFCLLSFAFDFVFCLLPLILPFILFIL